MTYGRGLLVSHTSDLDGAVVSHLAELVRGDFLAKKEGPLIRPSAPSPQGEKDHRRRRSFIHEVSCLKQLAIWRRLHPLDPG
jgi:hypothetical protein